MKKFVFFIIIFFIFTIRVIAEEKPLTIGCDLLLDTKEDQSHITNSLVYFQKEIDKNNMDIAIFLIHSLANLETLKQARDDCFYNSNKILGTNHDVALQILIKKFPYIKKYEFRRIYQKFKQYENQNYEIIKKIQESSFLARIPSSSTANLIESSQYTLADELIDYYYNYLINNYNEIDNSLTYLCYFEENIIKKIDYCTKSAEEDDLYATSFLGKMYLDGEEDPLNKGFFLEGTKNFDLSEKYISKTDKLMDGLIKSSPSRSDKFNNWAKNYHKFEPYQIYKKAIKGDAESQYQMGILSISDFTPHGDNAVADWERFFGSLILEKKDNLKGKFIHNCVQAINWFEKSSKQNFAPAQYVLHEIYSNDYKSYGYNKTNFYKFFFNIVVNYGNINGQTIGESCVEEKNEKRVNNGYDLLFKAAENNEYRAQCKLGLLYSFIDDEEIRNLELGLTYILLSQQPRKQDLWKDGYHVKYRDLKKKGFDERKNEKCGKEPYKYLFPESPYYDQDLNLGEWDEMRIPDYSEFINGNMFNKNSTFYQRMILENKILSVEKIEKLFN